MKQIRDRKAEMTSSVVPTKNRKSNEVTISLITVVVVFTICQLVNPVSPSQDVNSKLTNFSAKHLKVFPSMVCSWDDCLSTGCTNLIPAQISNGTTTSLPMIWWFWTVLSTSLSTLSASRGSGRQTFATSRGSMSVFLLQSNGFKFRVLWTGTAVKANSSGFWFWADIKCHFHANVCIQLSCSIDVYLASDKRSLSALMKNVPKQNTESAGFHTDSRDSFKSRFCHLGKDSRHYYSIAINCRKNELEQKMFLNLHNLHGDSNFCISNYCRKKKPGCRLCVCNYFGSSS